MIIHNLYQTVLLDSAEESNCELYIVSGYASATFANKHLSDLDGAVVNLIIGMPGKRTDHSAYLSLLKRYGDRFRAYYYSDTPSVHSKVYAWFQGNEPVIAFSGSGNYSRFGFFSNSQVNQFTEEDPKQVREFFNQLLPNCVPIGEANFPDLSDIIEHDDTTDSVPPGQIHWEIPGTRVRISFLDSKGRLPTKSGLNWGMPDGTKRRPYRPIGQRQSYDQAYLSLKKDVRDLGFLPEKGRENSFTLVTDDKESFDCVVAQMNRKAIESTFDNSEIGRYFRKRLGIPFGDPVTVQNLINYGRTDYTLHKIDEETFLLDFSV